MEAEQYKAMRIKLGYTQTKLAALLGVNRRTIYTRESPGATISEEARRAILSIKTTNKTNNHE